MKLLKIKLENNKTLYLPVNNVLYWSYDARYNGTVVVIKLIDGEIIESKSIMEFKELENERCN